MVFMLENVLNDFSDLDSNFPQIYSKNSGFSLEELLIFLIFKKGLPGLLQNLKEFKN